MSLPVNVAIARPLFARTGGEVHDQRERGIFIKPEAWPRLPAGAPRRKAEGGLADAHNRRVPPSLKKQGVWGKSAGIGVTERSKRCRAVRSGGRFSRCAQPARSPKFRKDLL